MLRIQDAPKKAASVWLYCVFDYVSLPESPVEEMDYPLFISIGDWLDSIKMSQYKSNFMAAGYNTSDSVARMSIGWVAKPKWRDTSQT